MGGPLVLYDERCSSCSAIARMLERRGIAVAPIGSPTGDRWLRDLPEPRRYAAVHAIDAGGRRFTGGSAVPVVLQAVPHGRILARLAGAWPPATERAYRALARNRGLVVRVLELPDRVRRASRARAG